MLSAGRKASCGLAHGKSRVRRDAAQLIQFEQRGLRGQRGIARLALHR